MRDHLLQLVLSEPSAQRQSVARRYLHLYVLRLLHRMRTPLVLRGASAAHLVFGLPRATRDLLFDGSTVEDQEAIVRALVRALEESGYDVTHETAPATATAGREATRWMFRFHGLPEEGLFSPDPLVSLALPIELDTRPPAGAMEDGMILDDLLLPAAVRHHDLSTLTSGVVAALLLGEQTRGRDWFDLQWLLSEHRRLAPNMTYLTNLLSGSDRDPPRWARDLSQRLGEVSWQRAAEDVLPFTEHQDVVTEWLDRDRISTILSHA